MIGTAMSTRLHQRWRIGRAREWLRGALKKGSAFSAVKRGRALAGLYYDY